MNDGDVEYLQYRLVAEPRSAWLARHVVRAVVDGWQLGELADDVVSCVSELVANVHEHADSAIAELLLLWVPGAFLTADVGDQDARMPRLVSAFEMNQLTETGRGLAVAEALCDRLSWRPDSSGGKVVRCHWRLKAADPSVANFDPDQNLIIR